LMDGEVVPEREVLKISRYIEILLRWRDSLMSKQSISYSYSGSTLLVAYVQ